MKKLRKKLCNFTKVFLVFCLLFSNLSSLKVVFAYEGEDITETKEEELVETPSEDTTLLEEEKEDEYVDSEKDNNEEEIDENKINEENVEENKEEVLEKEDTTEDNNLSESVEENQENDSEETPIEEETPSTDDESELSDDVTSLLNDSALRIGLDGSYLFADKDGEDRKLYVVLGVNESEVEDIVNNAYTDATVSVVEDNVTISANGEVTTYQVVVYDSNYLDRLIKVAIGDGETTEDDDINGDGTVDAYDAATLRLILDYGFGGEVFNENIKIDAKLDGNTDSLVVGDTFTIRYIMTLAEDGINGITGLINYNRDMLTLDNVDVKNFANGSDYNGKFLYFGDYIMGEEVVTTDEDGEEVVTYSPKDYIIVEMTFTAIAGGSDAVTVSDIGYFNDVVYYSGNEGLSKDVTVISNDNTLSSLTIGGVNVAIDELTDVYNITVPNSVTNVDLSYVLSDLSASVTSIVAPEELAVGENTITITVVAENGEERTYTVIVTRESEEEEKEESEVANTVSYEDTVTTYEEEDKTDKEEITANDDVEVKQEENKDEGKLSRVIIIILILLAITGLIYLIFKDDDDDETKKVNRDINRFKKEDLDESKSNRINNNNKKTNKKGR